MDMFSICLQPLEQQQGVVPDQEAEYHLFDRVVNIRESFTVPLGLRGTIIGIKGGERPFSKSNLLLAAIVCMLFFKFMSNNHKVSPES